MTVKLSRYVFRRIKGRIVMIRDGIDSTDSLRKVSKSALRKHDGYVNKMNKRKVDAFLSGSKVKNKVFHGTNAKFTKFSHSKIGSNSGTAQGRGFYFAKDRFTASGYGKVKEYFINLKNPVKGSLNDGFKQRSITDSQMIEMVKGQDLSNWSGWGENDPIKNILKMTKKDNDIDKIQEIGNTVYHGDWKKALEKVRKVTGIDGSIASNDKVTHYVAYNSDQIMKAPKKSNKYKSLLKFLNKRKTGNRNK